MVSFLLFQAKDVDISRLALSYAFNTPGIDLTLVGISTQEILKKNLDALFRPLTAAEQEVKEYICKK